MRTVSNIMADLKDNIQKPTEDEAYFALLTLDTLLIQMMGFLESFALLTAGLPISQQLMMEAARTLHGAFQQDPKIYMGDYLPGTEKYDADRKKQKELMAELAAKIKGQLEQIQKEEAEIELLDLEDEDKLN